MHRTTLHDAIETALVDVEDRVEHGGVRVVGIASGITELDDLLSGFRKREMYIIASRPAMGKTALALTIAQNIAAQKHRVLFCSMEMSANLLAYRSMSALTNIPAERIERGQLAQRELQRVKAVLDQAKALPLDIIDERIDSQRFVQYLIEQQKERGCDFLIVDYVSLFRDLNRFGENERLSRISGNITFAAQALDVPVIVLSQLNRAVELRENHIPMLADLRDSGALEQDAFAVIFPYRPHYYEMMHSGADPLTIERDARIIVEKHRQGEIGSINVDFYPAQMRWASKDHYVAPVQQGQGQLL